MTERMRLALIAVACLVIGVAMAMDCRVAALTVMVLWGVLGALSVRARRRALERMRRARDGPRPIILFDGLCNLCNGFVQFCAARDFDDEFTFAPLESVVGRRIIARHKLFPGKPGPDSFVVIEEDGSAFVKSTAALRALSRLQPPLWILMIVFEPVPIVLRDWVYDVGWRFRRNIFGTRERSNRLPKCRAAM